MPTNPNVSSAQFAPHGLADDGLPYTMSEKDWDARSKSINAGPRSDYYTRDDDEAYRANFGNDYWKDPSFGSSGKRSEMIL